MPKNTFFNLPKNKMEKIIEVALEEFVNYSYENASINRIVERAEIAKGSFYQYFEDKKDLYGYIIEEAYSKKLLFMLDAIENMKYNDFFSSLKELYTAEINFALESSKSSTVIHNYTKCSPAEFNGEILKSNQKYREVFEKLILKGIENKDIDAEADEKKRVFLLIHLSMSILEYYINEVNCDFSKTMEYLDGIINLFKDGIKLKKRYTKDVEDRFY